MPEETRPAPRRQTASRWRFPAAVDPWLVVISVLTALYLGALPYMGGGGGPREPEHIPELEWWQSGVIYHIYPRSFMDSNGDGVGDIKGIESKLDYLKQLGVQGLWLASLYRSPMKDFGYDVSDFKDIDPVFGNLRDMDDLIEAIHKKGMHIILDFIPNHSSDQHVWFQQSRTRGADNRFRDYYVWHDGTRLENGSRVPPNNWLSHYGGSAWTWDDNRKQFYYHQYLPEQPDLNFRNQDVRQEMLDILQFWLDRGVDGFRAASVSYLLESEDTSLDEPRSYIQGFLPHHHDYLIHSHTSEQSELHDVTLSWRELFDDHENRTGKYIYMFMDVVDTDKSLRTWKDYFSSGADHPLNGLLVSPEFNSDCDGLCVQELVNRVLTSIPGGGWPSWVLGNHDNKRVAARRGAEFANVLNMLLLLLPGTPTTYYGEELAMTDIYVPYRDTQDPLGRNYGQEHYQEVSRDLCRSPMQWSSENNAGFSSAPKTWLPLHQDFKTRNVETQHSDPKSTLSQYRQLTQLRQEPAFQSGAMSYSIITDDIFSFIRHAPARESRNKYLIAMNVGIGSAMEDYSMKHSETGTVLFNTGNFEHREKEFAKFSVVNLDRIELEPGQGVVIEIHSPPPT